MSDGGGGGSIGFGGFIGFKGLKRFIGLRFVPVKLQANDLSELRIQVTELLGHNLWLRRFEALAPLEVEAAIGFNLGLGFRA